MLDFNTEPYNDDYNEDSKFYRILFRPSFAVQARELTQLQTILQNQISRHGGAIFKQGSMVVPGQVSIDTNAQYVKLTPSFTSGGITSTTESFISSSVGKYITGSSGIQAQIIKVVASTSIDPTTLFVRYLSSDTTTGTQKVFADSEIITFDDGTNTIQTYASGSTGVGSLATVTRGIYYVNGFFVLCADPRTTKEQTIVLDKYSNTPSYRVGLSIIESELTPEEDTTLLDNAQTSYNYAAPGAHRYHIDLILTKLSLNSVNDQNFIELLQVDQGTILRIVNTTQYSELEKTLARRTYDEAGNYTVRPFSIDVREARNNSRGAWTTTPTSYLIGDIVTYAGKTYTAKNNATSASAVPPTHTTGTAFDGSGNTGVNWEYTPYPVYNRGISLTGSDNQLAIALDPGKAYVQGYEIEKVATEYVYIDKCRDTSHQVQVTNAFLPATVGNYVYVNAVNSVPFVDTFVQVALYNQFTTTGAASAAPGTAVGTQVGTARVRFIEWDNGTIGTTAAQYKVGLFDIQMFSGYDFKRNVKSFYYNNLAGGSVVDFSGDIVPIPTRLVGAATASSSTTITGSGTSFLTDLVVGDYVSLGGTYRRVTAIASQNSITVDQSTSVTGVTIDRVTTQIYEPENESLIFKLPYYAIKSLTSGKTTYYVYQKFTGTASALSGSNCTLTVSTGSGTMVSAAQTNNYQLVDNTTGLSINYVSAAISTGSITFTLAGTYANRSMTVIGTVVKTVAEKTKTLTTATPVTFTTQAAAQALTLSLGKADGYRITSVLMDSGSFASPTGTYTIDISDHYNFNDGQTSSFYGLAKLELKPSYTVPSGPVKVSFEYFTHGSGDYFSANSYTSIDYKKIPFFGGTSLRDSIDFRPRVDDTGLAFTGSGGSVSLIPKRGQEIQTDFTYYLPRTDKIAIDTNGQFFQVAGTPSLNPGDPEEPKQGMVLYTLNLEPYTFSTTASSVRVTKVENKRYTMRDIGKLESRINNLEYYTSLSLLEQQTESLTITDSTTGLNRFKNGFVVDNFSGHNVGDVASTDYYCSIDMNLNQLRSFYSMKNVGLIEKVSTTAARTSANYQITGDLITLPYTTTALITQPYASRLENVNPFAIFTFLGQVNLNPPSDVWFETDRRPDIVQNTEGDFNTIATLAEKAGVLGTVWGAWQTQWTGQPVASQNTFVGDQRGLGTLGWRDGLAADTPADQLNAMFGDVQGQGWAHRVVTTETTATQSGLTRTGVNTQVVAKIDTQLVADRILSTAVIPYVRSRNILIQATGLKPNTTFYPFFDNVNVSAYCTPATKITYTGDVDFDTTSNVGANTTQSSRLINGDSQSALSTGDVITGQTSSATAVVVGTEKVLDSTGSVSTRNIYVVNIKGTFTAGESIVGSISGVTGTNIIIEAAGVQVAGGSLGTDVNGKVQLLFNIPQNDTLRFRTGQRQFTLSDSSSNDATYTSRGNGQYFAQGVLETKQATYNSVRNGILVQNQVDPQYQTVINSTTRTVSDTGWYDPLAQTFMINSNGGAFLTSVDLFFATKDRSIPVHVEIREVVNGSPGKTILPFSQVALPPEQVNISTNNVTLPDGTVTPSYDTATRFTFPSPVYVNDATEYALVVASDSNGYKAWISNMGDTIPGSSRTISQQPYAGVLFKSQNGSTWTANQDQDLTFTLNRAVFATNTIATVQFVNDIVSKVTLDKDPFETNNGVANIRVYHRNHGLAVNSYVTLSNSDSTKIYGSAPTSGTITCTTGGTTVTGSSTVFQTDIGTTTIGQGAVLYTNEATPRYIGVVASVTSQTALTLVANAAITLSSATGFTIAPSLNGIPVTEVYKLSTITAVTDNDSYVLTTTTTGKKFGYCGGQTATAIGNLQYNALQPIAQIQNFADATAVFSVETTTGKSINGSETPYSVESTFSGVNINDTNYFSAPRVIASQVNENSLMSGNKSFTIQAQMQTTNDAVSPVLDTKRMGLIAISNTLNNPSESVINYGALDQITLLSANTNIAFTSTGISSADSSTKALLATLQVGKYITISGSGTTNNNGTYLITGVASDGATVTISNSNGWTTVSSGTAITIVYRNSYIDEISPSGSSTHSKYVTKKISLATPATSLKIRMSVNSPTASNVAVYYRTSPVGNKNAYSLINYVLVQPDGIFPKVQYGDNTFKDIDYTINGLTAFDAFNVKLVFTSTNTSEVSKCKDLRIIATS